MHDLPTKAISGGHGELSTGTVLGAGCFAPRLVGVGSLSATVEGAESLPEGVGADVLVAACAEANVWLETGVSFDVHAVAPDRMKTRRCVAWKYLSMV